MKVNYGEIVDFSDYTKLLSILGKLIKLRFYPC